ncbi:hypothetical protein, conserved [Plasmodium gonderi]|uniref:Uncharacterized protein n=1 Tax=Plasmodium gonderi TaxID=77519 RepID=A0A1Y1JIC2_PLAGO|nr:hypothetical protein, conserved [Plasmodium gonderi]GAW81115.1 hypothetical protein, conserved [Plasmodium gonderi]
MCDKALKGCFYKNCTLYVGEYILSEELRNDEILDGNVIDLDVKKNDLLQGGEKKVTNKLSKKDEVYREILGMGKNEESNDYIRKDNSGYDHGANDKIEEKEKYKGGRGLIFHGKGKYIKANEMFVGDFENNKYRKGIWVKYKNIHNLFYYMNIHHMMCKENNEIKQKYTKNFRNFLYVPLREVNIYIGEFHNNMFNGFSLYYFYPFLYVGYFINNLMNGYGYMFYINSVHETVGSERKKENIVISNNLFDFSFLPDGKKKEKKKNINNSEQVRKGGKEGKLHVPNEKNVDGVKNCLGKEDICKGLLFNVYKKLESMIKNENRFCKGEEDDHQGGENILGDNIKQGNRDMKIDHPSREPNIIEELKKDVFKNFKLQISRKNKINRIKKFLNENEKQNFFDIFKYISYEHLIFQGYFYNNHFSSTTGKQELYKNLFIQMYEQIIIKKINSFRNNIVKGMIPQDLCINEDTILYVLEKEEEKKKKFPDVVKEHSDSQMGTTNDTPNNEQIHLVDEKTDREQYHKVRDKSLCNVNVRYGRTQDGKTQDGKIQDGKIQDGKIQDGKTQDGKTQDGKIQDGKIQDGKTQDGKTQDGKTQDGKTQDGKTQDGKIQDGKIQDGKIQDGKIQDGKTLSRNMTNERYRDIVDLNLLRHMFEATEDNNVEYGIEVVKDNKILKYMSRCDELKMDGEKNYLDKATLNLNGHYQLVVINIKCKEDKSLNLNTNKCNIQNIYKIKMFLISSDKSSIITHNMFFLYYIHVYIRNPVKKEKTKIRKKKN